MRVLVTGGASALAQAVALQLCKAGHVVRLSDRPGRGLRGAGLDGVLKSALEHME
jgi:nucleoside-diphosphate-sugar epimerase